MVMICHQAVGVARPIELLDNLRQRKSPGCPAGHDPVDRWVYSGL